MVTPIEVFLCKWIAYIAYYCCVVWQRKTVQCSAHKKNNQTSNQHQCLMAGGYAPSEKKRNSTHTTTIHVNITLQKKTFQIALIHFPSEAWRTWKMGSYMMFNCNLVVITNLLSMFKFQQENERKRVRVQRKNFHMVGQNKGWKTYI